MQGGPARIVLFVHVATASREIHISVVAIAVVVLFGISSVSC